jgi:hypothetical protein
MLRAFSFLGTLLLVSPTYAGALSPFKRQIGGVGIVPSGCDNDQIAIINNALNDAIKLAYGIMGIDTKTDVGAFDCEYLDIVSAFLSSCPIHGMSNDYVALASAMKDVAFALPMQSMNDVS